MAKPNIFSIIPKPKEQESRVVSIAFWLLLVALVASLSAVFILRGQVHSLESKKISLIEERNTLVAESTESAKKMADLSKKVSDFLSILKEHKVNSNLYDFLAGLCHRRVQLVSLNVLDTESHLSFALKTESFKTLGEQLLILKNHPLIKNVKFSGLSIEKDGAVSCTIDFDFDEKVVKPFKGL